MPQSTPDITPAQIVAAITAVIVLLVSNTLISSATGKLVTDLAAVVIPAAWMIADAVIRHGRAKVVAAQVHAEATRVMASSSASNV